MPVLGLDLGGTKLAAALFSEEGAILSKEVASLDGRKGDAVGDLIASVAGRQIRQSPGSVKSVGISVPGIARSKSGTVWVPNIPGWLDYPLVDRIRHVAPGLSVAMDSDRGCCMRGEIWRGNARGCSDAIFLSVGTGIGAGILADGRILRGADDIAGSIGWMALDKPFLDKYVPCGCFEYYSSGDGIARLATDLLREEQAYDGPLGPGLTAHDVFAAYRDGDLIATRVLRECIEYWGMGVANLISIFNPEKVIFGGGVFGPALMFLDDIAAEARKWAQPVSMSRVVFEPSGLDGDAAIYGAGYLALHNAPATL